MKFLNRIPCSIMIFQQRCIFVGPTGYRPYSSPHPSSSSVPSFSSSPSSSGHGHGHCIGHGYGPVNYWVRHAKCNWSSSQFPCHNGYFLPFQSFSLVQKRRREVVRMCRVCNGIYIMASLQQATTTPNILFSLSILGKDSWQK